MGNVSCKFILSLGENVSHGTMCRESTYTFSPITGFIHQHIVDSILPTPHVAVYDSLRLTLGKLLGWEPGSGATTNGVICNGKR